MYYRNLVAGRSFRYVTGRCTAIGIPPPANRAFTGLLLAGRSGNRKNQTEAVTHLAQPPRPSLTHRWCRVVITPPSSIQLCRTLHTHPMPIATWRYERSSNANFVHAVRRIVKGDSENSRQKGQGEIQHDPFLSPGACKDAAQLSGARVFPVLLIKAAHETHKSAANTRGPRQSDSQQRAAQIIAEVPRSSIGGGTDRARK